MLTISLFKIEFISNPYVKANIVELVYYLIVRKKSLMRDVFKYNDFAKVWHNFIFFRDFKY